jgi:transposase
LIILEQRQHPEQSYKSCQGILSYAARVGKERLNAACQRAAFYNEYNYLIIRKIIENKLDQAPLDQEPDREMPPHGNIRGNEYYQ